MNPHIPTDGTTHPGTQNKAKNQELKAMLEMLDSQLEFEASLLVSCRQNWEGSSLTSSNLMKQKVQA